MYHNGRGLSRDAGNKAGRRKGMMGEWWMKRDSWRGRLLMCRAGYPLVHGWLCGSPKSRFRACPECFTLQLKGKQKEKEVEG